MPTAQDYVVRARQKLRIHADEEPLQAYELDKGIDALTDILTDWVGRGVIKSFAGCNTADDIVTITLLDDTIWTFEANRAIIGNLAMAMASDYGKTVDPQMARDVAEGERSLLAKGFSGLDTKASFEAALSYMPSQGIMSAAVDTTDGN